MCEFVDSKTLALWREEKLNMSEVSILKTDELPGWSVSRLSGTLGAEIAGIDLNQATKADAQVIANLLAQHHVLVFHGQQVDNPGLMRFGKLFGPLSEYPFKRDDLGEVAGYVMALKNDPFHTQTALWHADATAWERPPSITILRAEKLPEAGGDTLYANQQAAFAALSEPYKQMLRQLRAIHFYDYGAQGTLSQSHPVVRTHPVTKRESLYINDIFVKQFDGMTIAESRPILEYLMQHATEPNYGYRHRWQPGDVVMWDNRSVLHRSTHDYGTDPDARLVCNVQTLCEAVV